MFGQLENVNLGASEQARSQRACRERKSFLLKITVGAGNSRAEQPSPRALGSRAPLIPVCS